MDLVHGQPHLSQRELAQKADVSLGSVNYCLKALTAKGWLKANKFKDNPDKSVYLYLLTPEGIAQRSRLAVDFLRRKKQEYDELKQEIEQLTEELHESL